MASKIATQLAKQLAETLSVSELETLLREAEERKAREAEAAANRKRQDAAARIAELLRLAEDTLKEAGELAAEHKIPFTFVTPRGESEYHPGRWMNSACCVGDGWYAERFAYSGEAPKSSVDGMTL